jgi:hypothetical protein
MQDFQHATWDIAVIYTGPLQSAVCHPCLFVLHRPDAPAFSNGVAHRWPLIWEAANSPEWDEHAATVGKAVDWSVVLVG